MQMTRSIPNVSNAAVRYAQRAIKLPMKLIDRPSANRQNITIISDEGAIAAATRV